MKYFLSISVIFLITIITLNCQPQFNINSNPQVKVNPSEAGMEEKYDEFVTKFEKNVSDLTRNLYEAYFQASINSNDANWNNVAQLEMKYNAYMSDPSLFKELMILKESKKIDEPIKSRMLAVLYNDLLSKQIDVNTLNTITKMGTDIENKFSNFRAEFGSKKLTDNDVEEILEKSKDNNELKNVWLAQKKIGTLVAQDIINLVKKRNELAKKLGFKNYHDMSLRLTEQDPVEIQKLFDELDELTRDAFAKEKAKIDEVLAKQLKIKKSELMPWHYQNRFFQEAPKIYSVDLDKYYKDQDVVKLTEVYFKGINLPISDLLAKSDLYEKPNKNQHAYCIDIDRMNGDIRVLCNAKNNSKWMNTMMHEFGHALFEKWLGDDLPWELKQPAHIFTTEAIAMLFGRLASNPQWMLDMKLIDSKEKTKISKDCFNTLRLEQLVFSRWSQVMYRFEKSLYDNPDQDLNKLWWDLVEKYQMLKRPEGRNEPDWASKIHIATSPCYYHNYHLGELLASQLYYTIATKVVKAKDVDNQSFVNKPEVGQFLIDNVFRPGMRYPCNEMIEKETGEKLTAKYYAKQFVK